jgi:hypothetical protein
MSSIKSLVSVRKLTQRSTNIGKTSLFFFLLLAACSPVGNASVPVDDSAGPVQERATPTSEGVGESALTPTVTEEQIYPYFLPLAIKPDISSQTIDGVTAKIDWAYADESRLAIHYTISGLDWPDGTPWDAMQVQVTSPAISGRDFSGAGGWDSIPAEDGVISGGSDMLLSDGGLNAEEHPTIKLNVEIPVEGPSSEGPFRFEFEVPVLDGIKIENIDQNVVTNNVSMTLRTLILSPSHAEALICFQMPSAADWGLTASTVSVGGKEFPFTGSELVTGTDGKNFAVTDPERCNSVGFDIPYDETATSFALNVPKLIASIPEVITKERVEIANQRLAARGIEFDFVNVDHGGNIVLLKQPEGMTDAEIYPLIWEALAEQYEGPWLFTVPIAR